MPALNSYQQPEAAPTLPPAGHAAHASAGDLDRPFPARCYGLGVAAALDPPDGCVAWHLWMAFVGVFVALGVLWALVRLRWRLGGWWRVRRA